MSPKTRNTGHSAELNSDSPDVAGPDATPKFTFPEVEGFTLSKEEESRLMKIVRVRSRMAAFRRLVETARKSVTTSVPEPKFKYDLFDLSDEELPDRQRKPIEVFDDISSEIPLYSLDDEVVAASTETAPVVKLSDSMIAVMRLERSVFGWHSDFDFPDREEFKVPDLGPSDSLTPKEKRKMYRNERAVLLLPDVIEWAKSVPNIAGSGIWSWDEKKLLSFLKSDNPYIFDPNTPYADVFEFGKRFKLANFVSLAGYYIKTSNTNLHEHDRVKRAKLARRRYRLKLKKLKVERQAERDRVTELTLNPESVYIPQGNRRSRRRQNKREKEKAKLPVAITEAQETAFLDEIREIIPSSLSELTGLIPWVLYVYQAYRARNFFDHLAALTQFVNALGITAEQVDYIIGKFSGSLPTVEKVRTESLSDNLQLGKEWLSALVHNHVGKLLRDILLTAASFQIFDEDLLTHIKREVGQPIKITILGVLTLAFDSLVLLIKAGERWWQGVPLRHIFDKDKDMPSIYAEFYALTYYTDKLYYGLPTKGYMCAREYNRTLHRLLEQTQAYISRNAGLKNSSDMAYANRLLSLIRQEALEKEEATKRGPRPMPMGVVIAGDPGIGKSKILLFVADIWSRVKGRLFSPDMIYPRTLSSDFWEGWADVLHPYIHMSELGNLNENLASRGGDNRITEATSIMDTLEFRPDRAFAEKGKYCARPELVLIDTNNPGLNLGVLVSNKSAYERRFLYVIPTVKPEFRINGGTGIDVKKSVADPSPVMDRHTYDVYIVVSTGVNTSNRVYLLQGGDVYELVTVLEKHFANHIASQEAVASAGAKMIDSSLYSSSDAYPSKRLEKEEANDVLSLEIPPRPFGDKARDWIFGKMKNMRDLIGTLFSTRKPETPQELMVRWDSTQFDWMPRSIPVVTESGDLDRPERLRGISPSSFMRRYPTIEHLKDDSFYAGLQLRCQLAKTAVVNTCLITFWYFVYSMVVVASFLGFRDTFAGIGKRLLYKIINQKISYYSGKIFNAIYSPAEGRFKYLAAMSAGVLGVIGVFKLYSRFTKREDSTQKVVRIRDNYFECDNQIYVASNTGYITPEESFRQHAANESAYYAAHPNVPVNDRIYELDNRIGAEMPKNAVAVKGSDLWNSVLQPTTINPHTSSIDALWNSVSSNTRVVRIEGTRSLTTHILGIRGNLAIINTHALPDGVSTFYIGKSRGDTEAKGCMRCEVNSRDAANISVDLSIIELQGLLFKDILKHFSEDMPMSNQYEGYYKDQHVQILNGGSFEFVTSATGRSYVSNAWQFLWPNHQSGDCGLPLIGKKNISSCIFGIHAGGHGEYALALPVTRKQIETKISMFTDSDFSVASFKVAETEQFESASIKSLFRYEHLPSLDYLGKSSGAVMLNNKSRLIKTKLYPVLEKLYPEITVNPFGKPLMQPIGTGENYKSPYNVYIRKFNGEKAVLSRKVLNKVVDRMFEHIITQLPDFSIKPLPVLAAINGCANNVYYRRINVNTAAGIGFSGKKSKYLEPVYEDEILVREPDNELLDNIEKLIEDYSSDEITLPVYKASLKDEPRTLVKVKQGATRIFYAAPLDHLIVSKMFLKPIYSTIVEKRDVFGSAIGTNMHNNAKYVVNRLKLPNLMDGDISAFDQTVPYQIRAAVGRLLFKLCKYGGYNDFQLKVVRGLITAGLHPMVQLLMDMFIAAGLQPSGKDATGEDNTLTNRFLLMYFWYAHPELSQHDYFDHVSEVINGDDIVVSISDWAAEHFDATIYSDYCRDVYKMKFTNSKKDDTENPFLDLGELQFLKRTFVFRADINQWVAPLSNESMYKMIGWLMPSNHLTLQDQIVACCDSFLWEYAIGHSLDEYKLAKATLESQVKLSYDREFRGREYKDILTSIFIDDEETVALIAQL